MHGDIIAAARALVEIPSPERAAAISAMFYRAHSADKIMKHTGMPHQAWGNGSLLAATQPRPNLPEPSLSNMDYLRALQQILTALIDWKCERDPSLRRYGR
ncbi:hypothetical protein [Pseudorhodobacter ferrugineus]|uniref:DUF7742 family protein n=1 Tax=Pseudorhodobacter ferrugineus TaxID=77008 RepID=UPI00067AEDB1|nr:hypothetical protein [Pseudorhodobacter ferrugineus]